MKISTATHAMMILNPPPGKERLEVSDADRTLAHTAMMWALDTFSEKEKAGTLSDFEYNMLAVARSPVVLPRHYGIAAYIVVAYQKAMAEASSKARAPDFIGQAGHDFIRENCRVLAVSGYEGQYGWTWNYTIRTADGDILKWFASKTMLDDDGFDITAGTDLRAFAGKIKKHNVFNGKKETIVSHCYTVRADFIEKAKANIEKANLKRSAA